MKPRWAASITGLLVLAGCQQADRVPERALRVAVRDDGRRELAFDTLQKRRADYWQVEDPQGRKVELRFAAAAAAPAAVKLDDLPTADLPTSSSPSTACPTTSWRILYREGFFRLFHPPARLISCFPSMTDLAFNQLFSARQPQGYEAVY